MPALLLHVAGVVQGVGFRPFVYRIAHEYSLNGYVKNLGDAGVEIWIEGSENNIRNFINALKNRSPPLARVENIEIKEMNEKPFREFKIMPSSSGNGNGTSIIPPDVAICDDCLKELFDPDDPRYLYPFIVCTNCGPRFSIIESLPYDRENTSMKDFPMCDFCRSEYENPLNRRYHAEPVCCESCGPKYYLIDKDGYEIQGDPLKLTAKLLDEGAIIAIKGIGGFHIACDAFNKETVQKLRYRIKRPQQPFAIMAKDLNTVKKIAYVSPAEEEELKSYRRPIVLLRKKKDIPGIAPELHTIGIMLPYAGVHYILFHYSSTEAYVMTSGNYPDFPMVIDNNKISELYEIADYFLIHNRRIVNRIDDSVVRFHGEERTVIRRSRGFVPLPIEMPFKYEGIAMGAELMNSFSVIKGSRIYPSQYIGNTAKLEVMEFQRKALSNLRKIVGLDKYNLVVIDSHPLYNTSKEGKNLSQEAEVLKVQHHIAHIGSVMAEHSLQEIVGIAIDAVGYGLDGKTWGGEIFVIAPNKIKRSTHIGYYPLPGGDLASYYPLRALAGILSLVYEPEEIEKIIKIKCPEAINSLPHGNKELSIILQQLDHKINLAYTSSTGRFLDAVSTLLNVAYKRTYEGEPAMKLESIARGGKDLKLDISSDETIKIHEIFRYLIDSKYSKKDLAYSIHLALARAFAEEAIRIAEEEGIKNIGVSGGVAYNEIIMKEIKRSVKSQNFNFFTTQEIPRGDNGISVGQAYIGGMYLNGLLKKYEVG